MMLPQYEFNADMRSVAQRLSKRDGVVKTGCGQTQPSPSQQEGSHEEEGSSQRHVPPVGR
jgi:hypothetical protein